MSLADFTDDQREDLQSIDEKLIKTGYDLIRLFPERRDELKAMIADIRRNANNDAHGTGRQQ